MRPGVLAFAILIGVSCGTRVAQQASNRPDLPATRVVPGAVARPGLDPSGATTTPTAGSATATAAPTDGGSRPSALASSAGPTGSSRTASPGGAQERRQPADPTAFRPEVNGAATMAGSPTPDRATLPDPASSAAGPPSPLVIGTLGTYSGPVGGTLFPSIQGLQVWIRSVNDRGGVKGHPVRLIIFDDGADPARSRSQAREAIERYHVIAFVQNTGAVTGHATVEYITSKRVPVIGSDGQTAGNYTSPMYFPQMASADEMLRATLAGMAAQLVPEGKTRLAVVSCTEAQNCTHADQFLAEAAPSFGFSVSSRIRASLAQPDYTAECLSAGNAGAQAFIMVMDSNTVSRMAASCARQGYRPIFSAPGAVIAERFASDPNLDGLVAASLVFPWVQSGTPATDEYHRAMAAYGTGIPPGPSPATGWVAGKLFERAALGVSEPPTSESLLRSLWSIKDDDLGGLALPLTFVTDRPANPRACWFSLRVINKTWTSPDGYKRSCLP